MLKFATLHCFAVMLALSGCATPPVPGETADAVIARWGKPSAIHAAGQDRLYEYPSGPLGQFTWMARFGPDARLVSLEQVLTSEKFATLRVGQSTREEVMRTVGRPAEHAYLRLRDQEVWSYRYKEAGVWNSMMHVHFDRAGVVQMMQNGPDPMYEYNDRRKD